MAVLWRKQGGQFRGVAGALTVNMAIASALPVSPELLPLLFVPTVCFDFKNRNSI
jgi:hypothetical protein